ncbi:MAG: FAD-dependent oxidoreductase [Phycisphaerae bacterium]|nr:FAD-dependent oxidoreductase [Phycisphaerae bacterium]
MNTVSIEINGKPVTAKRGRTILEVIEEQGLDVIPTLCYSPELEPYGSCFVCVVELEGKPNLVPSCATEVAEGMKIDTNNPRVREARKTALELLLSNHYADCVSPCKQGCPAGVDAQGYIALAAMGEYRKAVDLVRQTNPLPAVCGRICVRKCEVVCRRQDVEEPVAINYIKRYVTDMPGAYAGTPEREESRGKSIGIVGAGPAGLTAAWFLGLKGYDTIIYENMPKAGGMLRFGIPEYRLPKAVLDREIDYITRAGVEIKCGVNVPKDMTIDFLLQEHDAVFLSPGAWGGKAMRVGGEYDTEGVVSGVAYLIEKAQKVEPVSGTILVVGGGNTAMDAARTSWRLGADKVIIVYRRTKAEMPADELEIEDCLKEGIELMELVAPVGITKEGNKIKALECIRMQLGEPDGSGRRRPIPMEGSEFDIPCDLAISAIGQTPLLREMLDDMKDRPGVSKWSTFDIDTKTMKTGIEGLFAGGDAADDGPTVVIDAIRDGQKAAAAIHAYLAGEELPRRPFGVNKEFWAKPGRQELGEIQQSPRRRMHEIAVEERKGTFREVATGFEDEDVAHEAERCLSCGCVAYDWCKLRLYAEEYGVDLEKYKGYVRKHKVDDTHPYLVYDPNKCILCTRCIRTCERVLPISAIGLVNRGFQAEMRPAMEDPLIETSCISCGNCVDACPTGALAVKYPFPGRACLEYEETATHCALCSVGCRIKVKKFNGDRYFIESSGTPGEYLCFYGRFANNLFINRRRLLKPVLREGLSHIETSYKSAYEHVTEGLKEAVKRYGPESVAVFVSPELSNEEMYMASRIAREGLGTNNIASLSLLASGMPSGALDESLGFTASTAGVEALRGSDLIFCNNTDTQADQLVLSVGIQEAAKSGAKLILSKSSEDRLDVMADLKLDPIRGRGAILINGIMQLLIEDGFFDRGTIESVAGGRAFLLDAHDYSLAVTAAQAGITEDRIRRSAEMIKEAQKVLFVHSPDRARDRAPGDLQALSNLVLLLRSAGIDADLILAYQAANAAGVEVCGADPAFLPGRKTSSGIPGSARRVELLDALSSGGIKAALVIGEDPMRHDRTAALFNAVEFLAACDWAETETTLFANVAIPITTFLESEATRINFEGRVINFKAAVGAPNGIKTWHVLKNIADHLGVEVPGVFSSISAEIRTLVKKNQGDRLWFYWNTGQDRRWSGTGALTVADVATSLFPGTPALTPCAQYKNEIQEIGIKHYRVSSRGTHVGV